MKKSELLTHLSKLRYCVLWPGNWADIGFTERPIWVNEKGYGYFSDDEPCRFFEIANLTSSNRENIKSKLSEGSLTANDLKGSPLDLPCFVDNGFIEEDSIKFFLEALEKSFVANKESFFCGEVFDGWDFFETESDLIQAFSRDDYSELWSGMSADELSIWIARLNEEKQSFELPIHLSIFRDEI